ncbi:conserved hypothetical protein [Ricinus communis]|uniref:Uncharacterized protein n=1 Tax=Ricinus communis TaxID=3988 RepID=B9RU37_RICCO|nr:conserved hypothetical protein [Ricinus communis]
MVKRKEGMILVQKNLENCSKTRKRDKRDIGLNPRPELAPAQGKLTLNVRKARLKHQHGFLT